MTSAQSRALLCCAVAGAVGLVLVAIGASVDPRLLARFVGLVLTLLAGIGAATIAVWRLIAQRLQPLDALFDEGVHLGYARGYREGRRRSRPVVVPISCPHCGEPLSGGDAQTG